MLRYRLFIFGRFLLEFSVSASEKLLYLLLFVFETRCSGTSFVDGVSIVVECRLIYLPLYLAKHFYDCLLHFFRYESNNCFCFVFSIFNIIFILSSLAKALPS